MELDLTKLKLDAPTVTMLEQVRTNVDDLTLVLGPVWQCSELEERDGTIEPITTLRAIFSTIPSFKRA